MPVLNIIHQRRQRRNLKRDSSNQRSQRLAMGIGFAVSALMLIAVLVGTMAYTSLTRSLPPLEKLSVMLNPSDGQLLQPTRLYDRSGQHLLAVLAPKDTPRVYATYSQLPQALINATIAAMQPDFWSSFGYSISGWQDPLRHPTLAQQLVSNLLLGEQPPTTLRAIHERMLAAQVTSQYGRQQVLEWFLNSADYGHYAYGAEAAAQLYLGKSITQIDIGEAALLAAIGQAPAINPIDAPEIVEQNRRNVIQDMLAQGMVNPVDAYNAVQNPPNLHISKSCQACFAVQSGSENLAPAFVNLVLSQLDEQFGAGRVERGGVNIITSLNYALQLQAVCAAENQVERLAGLEAAIPAADGSSCEAARLLPAVQPGVRFTDGSTTIIMGDPQSGQVLAAVGDLRSGGQGSLLSPKPAGSAITPFIYLTAFSRGLNPASLGWDIPGSTPVIGQVYHGPVSLRSALANDYLPVASQLLDQMGKDSVQAIAAPFGLNLPSSIELLKDDFEIAPLSLVKAYGVLADSGTLAGQNFSGDTLQTTTVLQVTGVDHSIWADWTDHQTRPLLSQPLAYLMNQVLSDESARWPSLGHPNPLEIGRPAGGKIAPSLDQTSAWTIGYTPQIVGVVWVGSASRNGQGGEAQPIAGVGNYSAELWHALMQYASRDLPPKSWDIPDGIVTASVCDPSGLLPTSACPNVVDEIFLEGRQPVQTDTLFQTFEVNSETGFLATVFTPPELVEKRNYMVLPAEARTWAKSAGVAIPPTEYDTIQEPVILPEVHITSPGMFLQARSKIDVQGSAAGPGFVSYRLEFGQGLYPDAWELIGSDSHTPVTEGLLGQWDTTGLNGLYALRLMVVRANQVVDQAVVQVTLDNTPPQVAITYPQAGQVISLALEPQVALQAQASDPFFKDVEFFMDGKVIGQASLAPFGVIWPAKIGKHTIKVVATDQAGNTSETSLDFSVGK